MTYKCGKNNNHFNWNSSSHSQYYDIRKMNQFLINKKIISAVSVTISSGEVWTWCTRINILWTAYSCLGISTAFSLPDLIIILLFQVTSFKERFFIKVQINCQSPIKWAYYASGIGKPILCCYCAAERIQHNNDLKKKYWVVLPLCQACLRDKKPILKRNPIKNWQNMNLMLHNCF
jgi:hypothetical protein